MRKKQLSIGLTGFMLALVMSVTAPHAGWTAGSETDGETGAVGTGRMNTEEGRVTEPDREPMNTQGNEAVEELSDLRERISGSVRVIRSMGEGTGKNIPPQVLENSAGIAVFPDLTKLALGIGGRYGSGVLMLNRNNEWNGPIFISLYGASVGAQLGAEQTDLIMVFTNPDTLRDFSDGELQLGAEASVAAGNWGAKAGASTEADVLVYKQTAGLFAGVALSGAVLNTDDEHNRVFFEKESPERAYYGDEKVFTGEGKLPETEQANPLIEALQNYTRSAGTQTQ